MKYESTFLRKFRDKLTTNKLLPQQCFRLNDMSDMLFCYKLIASIWHQIACIWKVAICLRAIAISLVKVFIVYVYVSMSGQSGSGRERDRGRTDYLSGNQKRKKKQKQEEQEKKEQAKMRRLDQFYLTKTSPGSSNVNATPASASAACTSEDHSEVTDRSSRVIGDNGITPDEDVRETGADSDSGTNAAVAAAGKSRGDAAVISKESTHSTACISV